mmetsp:Transcript_12042/g.22401  ORF Transcript_12042/g.22401 Transcript_12042/m.22401 type:complete len:130 (-) Transcript_12042:787-1176(-)
MKLTDDDLGAVLACVKAVGTLKTLKLAGCINITGDGLESLRGCISLEQIDLSLMGRHEKPYPCTKSRPSISEAAVLPILVSIIHMNGNSLKHIQIPKLWSMNASPIFDEFLEMYDEHLDSREFHCLFKM